MSNDPAAKAFLDNGGELGGLIAGHDWAATPLGPIEGWPQSLKTVVSLLLLSPVPMVLLWGEDGVMIYNDAYAVFAEARHPRLLGSNVREGWPEVADFNDHVMKVGLAGGTLAYRDQELTLERSGAAEPVWMNLDYSPVLDESGRPAGVIAIVVETTERVQAERVQAFRLALETRLRDLLDAPEIIAAAEAMLGEHLGVGRVGYGDVDETERFFTTPSNWTDGSIPHQHGTHDLAGFGPEIWGALRRGETLSMHDVVTDPRTASAAHQAAFAAIDTRAGVTVPLVKDGRMRSALYVHSRAPRQWSKGDLELIEEVAGRTWSAVERARSDAGRRTAEERLRIAQRAGGVGAFEVFAGSGSVAVSEEFCRLWGLPVQTEYPVAELFDRIHPDDRDRVETGRPSIPDGALKYIEYRIRRGDTGEERWITRRGEALLDARSGRLRHVGVCYDTTARKRTEQAVHDLNQRLSDLNATLEAQVAERTVERDRVWHNSRDLLVVIGVDGIFRAVNPASHAILGFRPDEIVGRSFLDFIHPEDAVLTEGALDEAARRADLTSFENRYLHRDGTPRWISWHTSVEGDLVYAYGRDITASKRQAEALQAAQEQLRQSQKMEAVGQLTGGIAHDFNNLLTIISSSAAFLRRRDLADERRRRYVDAISDTADRAAKLTGQLLAFARRQPLRPEVFEAGEQVGEIVELIRPMLGARVRIRLEAAQEPCFVEADRSQFETALVNLAINARDAMEGEGELTVAVRRADGVPATRGHVAAMAEVVAVSISDTGSGIRPDQLERIFEPFYTTKEVGKGTGLGLSQVFGFVKQSGGEVTVDSEPGRGATFTLYLRRNDPPAPAADQPLGEAALSPAQRNNRLLVVEDNEAVGAFSTQMLQDLGYETTWAPNAERALAFLEADELGFDVVFSDVVMPGMGGIELAQRIRAAYPGLPVVLTSGYSHILAKEGTHGFELLQKPYSVETLARVLRKAVAGAAGPFRPPAE